MSTVSLIPANQAPPPPTWPPNLKVGILNPVYPLTDCRWAISLPRILQNCPPNSVMLSDWRYGVGTSREALVHSAISGIPDLTHILFLDADTLPEDGAILRLFLDLQEHPEIQMISGIYFNSLLTGLAAWVNEQALKTQDLVGRENPLIECQKTGMGCFVMKADIIRELDKKNVERPFFYYKLDARQNQMMSEDFFFFQKVKENLGFSPWIDLRCRCMHLKNLAISPEGQVQGGVPNCPPGQHWDPAKNQCVANT